MAQASFKPALRPFLPADAAVCAAIAEAAIAELTGEDYSEFQQQAWIETLADEDMLRERLAAQLSLLATVNEAPVGFASLRGNSHIDLLYVYPSAARQGVGTSLCDALEKLAAARGTQKLTADVSDTAQPFFAARGYVAQQRNTVQLGDEWLGNVTMMKALTDSAGEA